VADKAALLGHPVGHTLSPQVFAALSRLLDREVKYKAIDAAPDKLSEALDKLKKEEYAGCNITIPHKRAVMALAGNVSGEARAIGAANCLKIEKSGGVKATNTDAAGFYDALSETGFKPRDARIQILGAGGAARAVTYALGRAGARYVNIWARKSAAAEALAKEMAAHWPDTIFSAGPFGPAELWINCTPLGMEGFPDKLPMKKMEGVVVAFDLVYGKETKFQQLGAASRAKVLTGIPMLVYQAIRSWEFWFGPVGGQGRVQLKQDLMRLKKWR
jgi:shikimate dehydrogenase